MLAVSIFHHRLPAIALVALLTASCTGTNGSGGQDAHNQLPSLATDTVAVRYIQVDSTNGKCRQPTEQCAEIKFLFPELSGVPNTDSLNARLRFMTWGSVGIAKAIDTFFTQHQAQLIDLPGIEANWLMEYSTRIIDNRPGLFTAEFSGYRSMGGAHPNYETKYRLFDVALGKELTMSDFFVRGWETSLLSAGEAAFRRARRMKENENFGEQGFEFKRRRFELPDWNFGLKGDSIIFHYNPYEIGAYILGSTTFKVPLSEIQAFIQPRYQTAVLKK